MWTCLSALTISLCIETDDPNCFVFFLDWRFTIHFHNWFVARRITGHKKETTYTAWPGQAAGKRKVAEKFPKVALCVKLGLAKKIQIATREMKSGWTWLAMAGCDCIVFFASGAIGDRRSHVGHIVVVSEQRSCQARPLQLLRRGLVLVTCLGCCVGLARAGFVWL